MGICYKLEKARDTYNKFKMSSGSFTNIQDALKNSSSYIDGIKEFIPKLSFLSSEKDKQAKETSKENNLDKLKNLLKEKEFILKLIGFATNKSDSMQNQVKEAEEKKDIQSVIKVVDEGKETIGTLTKGMEISSKEPIDSREAEENKAFMSDFFRKNGIDEDQIDRKVEAEIKQMENKEEEPKQDDNNNHFQDQPPKAMQWGEVDMMNEA